MIDEYVRIEDCCYCVVGFFVCAKYLLSHQNKDVECLLAMFICVAKDYGEYQNHNLKDLYRV
jgi:hypothetical protein